MYTNGRTPSMAVHPWCYSNATNTITPKVNFECSLENCEPFFRGGRVGAQENSTKQVFANLNNQSVLKVCTVDLPKY